MISFRQADLLEKLHLKGQEKFGPLGRDVVGKRLVCLFPEHYNPSLKIIEQNELYLEAESPSHAIACYYKSYLLWLRDDMVFYCSLKEYAENKDKEIALRVNPVAIETFGKMNGIEDGIIKTEEGRDIYPENMTCERRSDMVVFTEVA